MYRVVYILFLVSFFIAGVSAQDSKRPVNIVSNGRQYVVNDKDGRVNLREEPDINSNILGTISNNTILDGIYGGGEDWIFTGCYIESLKKKFYGFIHKSRLLEIPQTIIKLKREHNLYIDWQISRIVSVRDTQKGRYFRIYFCDKEMTYGFVVDEKDTVVLSLVHLGTGFLDKYVTYKTKGYNFDKDKPYIRRYSYSVRDNKSYPIGGYYMDIQGNSLLGAYSRLPEEDDDSATDYTIIDDLTFVYSEFVGQLRVNK